MGIIAGLERTTVMPNLFRHPIGHSRMHGVQLACEVLKQVTHDKFILKVWWDVTLSLSKGDVRRGLSAR